MKQIHEGLVRQQSLEGVAHDEQAGFALGCFAHEHALSVRLHLHRRHHGFRAGRLCDTAPGSSQLPEQLPLLHQASCPREAVTPQLVLLVSILQRALDFRVQDYPGGVANPPMAAGQVSNTI